MDVAHLGFELAAELEASRYVSADFDGFPETLDDLADGVCFLVAVADFFLKTLIPVC